MRLIKSLESDDLERARCAMDEGTSADVIARAEQYLVVLEEHLSRLRTLKGVPKLGSAAHSRFARTLIEQVRNAIRTEVEDTTCEKNRIEALLDSFTMVSGWAAVRSLNEHVYRNGCDWELIGTEVRSISAGASLGIPDAIAEAGRLRREAYFAVRRAA